MSVSIECPNRGKELHGGELMFRASAHKGLGAIGN